MSGHVTLAIEPWEAKREDASERGWCVYDSTGTLVARRLTEANARIIAAGPDMLAALEAIFDMTDGEIAARFRTSSYKTEEQMAGKSHVYAMLVIPRNIARAAIAKAEAQTSGGGGG